MSERPRLPDRERVFIHSLQYHGFRHTKKRQGLKYSRGYVIPATKHEDSSGVDLWVKLPKETELIPVQITQRGVRIHRKFHRLTPQKLDEFISRSHIRIREKRLRCQTQGIIFILARDCNRIRTTPALAKCDVRALRKAVAYLKRQH